jgi:hypothetical protein
MNKLPPFYGPGNGPENSYDFGLVITSTVEQVYTMLGLKYKRAYPHPEGIRTFKVYIQNDGPAVIDCDLNGIDHYVDRVVLSDQVIENLE